MYTQTHTHTESDWLSFELHLTGCPVKCVLPPMCVCLPVGLVVRIDSSEALAPSDGSGVEASDRSNGQRHGGESSGWTPCTEQRRRAINRLLTPQNGRLIDHVFVISPTPDNVFSLFVYQFFVCHNWLVCHNLIFLSLEAE